MIVPGYLPVLHFYLYLIVLLSLVSLGQFSFHFQHSPHCGVQSQQKALVGRFQVFTGARLLQSLRPYLAKHSHFQQLISNWPDKLSRSLEGYFRVSCPQAPGIPHCFLLLSPTQMQITCLSLAVGSLSPLACTLVFVSTPCHLVSL